LVISGGRKNLSLDHNEGINGARVPVEGLDTLKGIQVPDLYSGVVGGTVKSIWVVRDRHRVHCGTVSLERSLELEGVEVPQLWFERRRRKMGKMSAPATTKKERVTHINPVLVDSANEILTNMVHSQGIHASSLAGHSAHTLESVKGPDLDHVVGPTVETVLGHHQGTHPVIVAFKFRDQLHGLRIPHLLQQTASFRSRNTQKGTGENTLMVLREPERR